MSTLSLYVKQQAWNQSARQLFSACKLQANNWNQPPGDQTFTPSSSSLLLGLHTRLHAAQCSGARTTRNEHPASPTQLSELFYNHQVEDLHLGNTYSSLCLEGAKRHNFNTPRAPNVQWPMSNSALICSGKGCDSCQIFFAASPPPTASLSAPSLLHDSLSESSHGTQSTLFPHHLLSISLAAASLLLEEHFILYLTMLSWHNEDESVLLWTFLTESLLGGRGASPKYLLSLGSEACPAFPREADFPPRTSRAASVWEKPSSSVFWNSPLPKTWFLSPGFAQASRNTHCKGLFSCANAQEAEVLPWAPPCPFTRRTLLHRATSGSGSFGMLRP